MSKGQSWIDNKMTELLSEDYHQRSQTPVFVNIGEQQVMVPPSYARHPDRFLDDLFCNEKHAVAYDKYNANHPDTPLEVNMLQVGDAYIVPDIRYVKSGMPQRAMIALAVAKAKQNYRNALTIAQDLRRQFPDKIFPVTLNRQELQRYRRLLSNKRTDDVANFIMDRVHRSANWSKEQCQQALRKMNPAWLKATAYLNKSNYHSVRGKFDKIEHSTLGRRAAYAAVALFMAGTLSMCARKFVDNQVASTEQTAVIPTDTIRNSSDFLKLYTESMYPFLQALIPIETLQLKPYSDNCKTINTIGMGGYFMPKDGNPRSSEWILTSEYVNKHPEIKRKGISSSYALELIKGWYCSRDNGRVYKTTSDFLMGCCVKPNEYVAMASCCFRNESYGWQMLDFFRAHSEDKEACARKLLTFVSQDKRFKIGIMKRCIYETIILLNVKDIYNHLGELKVAEGINSKGNPFISPAATAALTPKMIEEIEKQLQDPKLSVREILEPAADSIRVWDGSKITGVKSKSVKTVNQIMAEHNIHEDNCIHIDTFGKNIVEQDLYQQATEACRKNKHRLALKKLDDLNNIGYHKVDADLLRAEVCFNLGDYDACRQACRLVLQDAEHPEKYSSAYDWAANACEKLGDKDSARLNRQLAERERVQAQPKPSALTYVERLLGLKQSNGK